MGSLTVLDDVQREWIRPNGADSVSTTLVRDPTLSRRFTNPAMSLRNPSAQRITLKKTIAGTFFSRAMPLILRAFNRRTSALATCQLQMRLVSSENNSIFSLQTLDYTTSLTSWSYSSSAFITEWDVANAEVTIDCNTSASNEEVLWTGMGLVPDPAFACQCPQGFYNQVLSHDGSNNVCIRCPAGFYCASGVIRPCDAGMFSFGKSGQCEKCRDGWICVNGLATLCEAGTYVTNSSSCSACPEGFACRNGKK
jgi:hypothetical protein